MKKTMSLVEQVQAARMVVESWPESVRSATDLRHSDFFHETIESIACSSHSSENHSKSEGVLEA